MLRVLRTSKAEEVSKKVSKCRSEYQNSKSKIEIDRVRVRDRVSIVMRRSVVFVFCRVLCVWDCFVSGG